MHTAAAFLPEHTPASRSLAGQPLTVAATVRLLLLQDGISLLRPSHKAPVAAIPELRSGRCTGTG